jgi:RNA polymerase sigma-54 factor
LSKLDLQEEIAQEMVDNPALEEGGTRLEMSSNESSTSPAEREVTTGESAERADDDFDYTSFFRDLEDSYRPTQGMTEYRSADELPTIEQYVSSSRNLADHLSWQIEMSVLSERQRAIGEAIVGNLDDSGFLGATIEEIAAMRGEGDDAWTAEEVDEVRRIIQRFDPVGVASVDIRDCLLVQLELQGMGDSLAAKTIRDHLDLLEAQRYDDLAEALGVNNDGALSDVLEIIRHLDPRPGERYAPQHTTYITPDAYVVRDGDEYRVVLNEDGLPRLRVSPSYRRFLERASAAQSDRSAKDFARDKVRAAMRLIRSLEERQRTISKVANSIVKHQRAFLDQGIDAIRPLVLRDVAEDIGMHESTVSRVVNAKYIDTPRGLFEMRFFFHSGLSSSGGESISSLSVKEKIKRLVSEESPKKPLSDQAIADALKDEGLKIARRTVAKYREELHIPPSTQRRRSGKLKPR